jgi:hypothetical protein
MVSNLIPEQGFTLSLLKRVKGLSGINPVKGENSRTKRVKPASPEPFEENPLKRKNAASGSANAPFSEPNSPPKLFPSRQVSYSGKGAAGNGVANHKTELFRRATEILGPKKRGMITNSSRQWAGRSLWRAPRSKAPRLKLTRLNISARSSAKNPLVRTRSTHGEAP